MRGAVSMRAVVPLAAVVAAAGLVGCASSGTTSGTPVSVSSSEARSSSHPASSAAPTSSAPTISGPSSSGGSSSSGTVADACSLLTPDETTGLGGKPPGSPDSNDLGKGCDFGPFSLTVAGPEVSTESFEYQLSDSTIITGLPAPATKAFHNTYWHWLRVETSTPTKFQVQCVLCGDDEEGLLRHIAEKVLGHL